MPTDTTCRATQVDACCEQLMRVLDDEIDVARAALLVRRGQAHRAVGAAGGRDGGAAELLLAAGTPMAAEVTGEPVRTDWRAAVPPRDGSVWRQLEDLRAITGQHADSGPAGTLPAPLEELQRLRGAADRMVGAEWAQ